MPWLPRGLREGVVTTRYPRHPDGYAPGFRGAVYVLPDPDTGPLVGAAIAACPTGAINAGLAGGPRVDRGRCILCARCVGLAPGTFGFTSSFDTGGITRESIVVPRSEESDEAVAATRAALRLRVRALRRSIHIRHVDAGSDGAEEWEVAALTNPLYDVHRLGIFFTASPRHADLLLVTGVGSAAMAGPLRETYEVMPEPKLVIAAGAGAISGGLIGHGYGAHGGVGDVVPVDVWLPGTPPSPFGLLAAILLAVGRLPAPRPDGAQPARSSLPTLERTAREPAPVEDPTAGAGS